MANLRFFFQSIRYSEDIDFDVQTISPAVLKKNVEKILEDSTFLTLLKHKDLIITDWSSPKQTTAAQRWKVSFQSTGLSSIPTKIEFSRRETKIYGSEIAAVHPTVIQHYQLQPVVMQHYDLLRAIEQKVGALIGRTSTQVRDVLDLKFLKDQMGNMIIAPISSVEKKKALENLTCISFDDYKAQVWPYLMGEYQDHYVKRVVWEQLQEEVFRMIEGVPIKS